MDDTALTVVEQREVNFYEDELTAVRADDGQIYVSIKSLCEALGITTAPQARRIKRTGILETGFKGITTWLPLVAPRRPACCGSISSLYS